MIDLKPAFTYLLTSESPIRRVSRMRPLVNLLSKYPEPLIQLPTPITLAFSITTLYNSQSELSEQGGALDHEEQSILAAQEMRVAISGSIEKYGAVPTAAALHVWYSEMLKNFTITENQDGFLIEPIDEMQVNI